MSMLAGVRGRDASRRAGRRPGRGGVLERRAHEALGFLVGEVGGRPPDGVQDRADLLGPAVAGPLEDRCSIRWEMPPRSAASLREPVSTQMPTATERTCSIRSVTTRIPLGSTLFR